MKLFSLSVEGRWKSAVNYTNPLGSKGKLAGAFAKLLHEMWGGDFPYLTPIDFRVGSRIYFVLQVAKSLSLFHCRDRYANSSLNTTDQTSTTHRSF